MIYHDINQAEKERLISEEFTHKSVIGTWGHNKAYIIQKVIFNKNPKTMYFTDRLGENLNIVEYFHKIYSKKIQYLDQPLFEIKISGKDSYIPPELCVFDGVPDDVRED